MIDAKELADLVGIPCDSARITAPCGRMFLVIGHNKHTKDDPGQWVRNGEPWDFEYLAESVVANGYTDQELEESVKEYARVSKMTWPEYLEEIIREAKP